MHAPLCHAQSDERSREPTEYRETIDEALREFDAQHFEEARSLFLHAHRLYPNARTHRALGLVEYELRNYIDSVIHLEVALASDTKRLNDAQRSETERVLSRAHKFVGRFMLQLRPSTSELTLDGKQIDARPDTPLLLGIGEHQLQVRAEGFEPQQRALDIKGGERETLTILLSAAHSEPIAAHSPATNDSAPGARRWYRSPWLWTGVAIVLAGAAVGTAYAVTRDAGGPEVQRGSSGIVVHGP
jgi:tetratricopeptide (TPR) repeat protein